MPLGQHQTRILVVQEGRERGGREPEEMKSYVAFGSEKAGFQKLTYPEVTCPDGYSAASKSECQDLAGYTWVSELDADTNWIDGCFEWYANPGGASNENTKRVYYKNRPGAVTGNKGGNRVCTQAAVEHERLNTQ